MLAQQQIWNGIDKPILGMLCSPKLLGLASTNYKIFRSCPDCGVGHWVNQRAKSYRCFECGKVKHRENCALPSSKKHLSECQRIANNSRYEQLGYRIWNGLNPVLPGMIVRGNEVGYKEHCFFVWDGCPNCKMERWVKLPIKGHLCRKCEIKSREYPVREYHPGWKGGRTVHNGYVLITLEANSVYMPMARAYRRILEHRLVMAKHLGRVLEKWEVVHHINGNRMDNSIKNLELLPRACEHVGYTAVQKRIKSLESRVTVLESENTLLETQIQEFKDERIRRL